MKKVLIVLLLLTGCGPTLIMLKNTDTGNIVQCEADPWGQPVKNTRLCAEAYEQNGYERIPTK